MRSSDLIRLLTLAAIWGASFLFMRVIAPVLGALWTAELRVMIAGLALSGWMLLTGKPQNWRQNWKSFLVLGAINSALPFAMYAYAAQHMPAGYSAIMNATTPLWGAVMGALFLSEAFTVRKLAGLLVGVLGVALLVKLGPVVWSTELMLALLACSGATVCYALAGVYTKKLSVNVNPLLMATASQLGAAFVLLPFLPLVPVQGEITTTVMALAVALALLCSAIAYLLYFRLIHDIGPTKALTVTFLIPLFALLWGAIFLSEHLTWSMAAGCAGVVLATWLVVSGPRK
ncbi:DMT family transporter [Undibacterium rugosum]|uniref:EamA family transporter n=1 Tax=Undibacterium rugosum TaxID=2762291 RepID=A0A923KY54_9BURK|nr:DMT family transporter [Undibacterium rugosum]MBC3933888.1 EamA family transporter [Undibacterium rugosum]MBR7777600.1 EamA family transporter [Undibacterium rugosum]